MHEWDRYSELNLVWVVLCRRSIAPQDTRKVLRTMGRVAQLATRRHRNGA